MKGTSSVTRWLDARKMPGADQSTAQFDALGSVHDEDIDRRSSDVGSAGKHGAYPGEMLLPDILAGVEKSRQQTCIGVEARDIRPLVEVVIQARQRQVFGDGRSVVLLGDDVVDLEGQNVERLREPTVFAGALGAIPNQTFRAASFIAAGASSRGLGQNAASLGVDQVEEVVDARSGSRIARRSDGVMVPSRFFSTSSFMGVRPRQYRTEIGADAPARPRGVIPAVAGVR